MPVLLWVAFWSSLMASAMASAACFDDVVRPVPIEKRKRH
jgi:hypothetical protein